MANKRINELALRTPQTTDLMLIGDPTTGYSYKTTLLSALNLGVPTTRTITINGTTFDLSANRTWSVGTVTSVGLTMPSAFNVASSPVTGSGTIAVTAAGLASQYIRGDGTLADFPGGGGGGGASVSYYLNGSVNQGTIGGIAFREMNKTPILGAGTNFTTNTNGYIASFITDPGDPTLLKIPGGNWNTEFYFAASSGGGTPTYYLELYKYDGSTFTLIASSSSNPDAITGGTSVEQYFTTIAVPETVLTATDRLAIRIYVTTAGRTITLHTENSNLCQIITTFTTGLTALNGLTAQVQYFATGSAGTDFNISSSTATHTFNIPTASSVNRGLLSSTDWTTFNNKVSSIIAGNAITVSNASGNVTVNHADTSGADPGATISGSNVFRSIVLDTYGHVTGLSYSSFLISDLGGTAISSPSNGQVLSYNGTNWVNSSLSGLSIITGSGTTNWVPKFTSSSAIGLSNIYDGGSFIGVFTATDNLSGAKLQVNGAATFSSTITATRGIFGTTGTGTFGVHISDNDQSNVRLRFTNTGTGGQAFSLVGGNPGASNAGFAIYDETNAATRLYISSTGAATFTSTLTAGSPISVKGTTPFFRWLNDSDVRLAYIQHNASNLIYNADTGSHVFNQNVGIGATPSAWTAFNPVLQIKTGSLAGSGTANFRMFANTYYDGSYKYIGTGTATQYEQDGYHAWYTAPSGSANAVITFTERMRLDASGNLGLGATPSAWSTFTAMQIKNASFAGQGNFAYLGANYYYDGSDNRYIASDFASRYQQFNGIHQWLTASSGTAGNIITFTQAMTLNASGNLGIGTTSPLQTGANRIVATINGTTSAILNLATGGTLRSYLYADSSGGTYETAGTNSIVASGSNIITFTTNSVERMRITSGGNVGIGTSSPAYKLDVAGYIQAADRLYVTNSANNVQLQTLSGGNGNIGIQVRNAAGSGSGNFWINSDGGNVGIGTTSPAQLLDVRSANTSGATGATIRIGSQNNGNSGDEFANLEFYWGDPDAAEVKAKIYTKNVGNVGPGGGGAADLLFATTPAFGSSTERMRIDSSGGVSLSNGILYISAGSGNSYSSRLSTAYSFPYVDTYLDSFGGSQYEGRIHFRTNSNGGAMTSRMVINNSGRILIGTTTDNTVDLLQVAGSVALTTNLKMTSMTTAGTAGAISTYVQISVNGTNYKLALYAI